MEKEIKIGNIKYIIKRFTYKEWLIIQENSARIDENGKVSFKQYEYFINSLVFGVKSIIDENGKEITPTREYFENLDHELGLKLFEAIRDYNTQRFFR
jgi:hypothetical protein